MHSWFKAMSPMARAAFGETYWAQHEYQQPEQIAAREQFVKQNGPLHLVRPRVLAVFRAAVPHSWFDHSEVYVRQLDRRVLWVWSNYDNANPADPAMNAKQIANLYAPNATSWLCMFDNRASFNAHVQRWARPFQHYNSGRAPFRPGGRVLGGDGFIHTIRVVYPPDRQHKKWAVETQCARYIVEPGFVDVCGEACKRCSEIDTLRVSLGAELRK